MNRKINPICFLRFEEYLLELTKHFDIEFLIKEDDIEKLIKKQKERDKEPYIFLTDNKQ